MFPARLNWRKLAALTVRGSPRYVARHVPERTRCHNRQNFFENTASQFWSVWVEIRGVAFHEESQSLKPARMRLPIALSTVAVAAASAADPSPEQLRYFEEKVRPILATDCYKCHSAQAEKLKGGLLLDTRDGWQRGGDSGKPIIVPGDPNASLLIVAVRRVDPDSAMPPKMALDAAKVAALETWVKMGAPDPRVDSNAVEKRANKDWWSFRALPKTTPPSPAGLPETWSANPIDRFIFARLAEKGLKPNPPAERRTLIRRVCFDLTGLPPTPEEVEAFVSSRDPQAYEKLVERLLASPRHGEAWARHWLDVVRFAESNGFEMNRTRPNAWPYRDYVIRAFNEDKPYDRFIIEQLAGDAVGVDEATGFIVGGSWDQVKSSDPVLTAQQRADELHDMVSTTGSAFLGITVGCARCHNHKFDPVPQTDYYALKAVLAGVQHGERPMRAGDVEWRRARTDALRKELAPLDRQLAEFQPKAQLGRIVIVDDSATPNSDPAKPSITQIEQPKNGHPITYSPGKERGQADDPGDLSRLPNLGESYRYWDAEKGRHDEFFAWNPRLSGRHRVWLSWGAWTTHAKDARYVLDGDGDLKTEDDQIEIANIDQSQFADGTPAIPNQKRWSGFRSAGEYDLKPESCIVLRSGEKGGPTVADAMLFEEITDGTAGKPVFPGLRPPVSHRANEELFNAVEAKFVRFTITAVTGGEPCIDELEVFTADGSKNVALGSVGTKPTASGVFSNGSNPKHKLEQLNDGRYGNDHSWISNQKGAGWVQLEFSKPQRIDRVVWSRDRGDAKNGKVYDDRVPLAYRIEVSLDGTKWRTVAGSFDRLASEYRQRIKSLPTLGMVPKEQSAEISKLVARRAKLAAELDELTVFSSAYAGKFQQPGPTFRLNRGDPMQPKEEVMPGALSEFGGSPLSNDLPEQDRRLALAKWIASPQNPLTARVMVNRLWHYHFGRGIADTPSDLGFNGGKPTHPELIDWLASEFIQRGWSLKAMHRLICTSATYRQSSSAQCSVLSAQSNPARVTAEHFALSTEDYRKANSTDADSRLLWRFPPHRLAAEPLRDAILAVTGKLDLTMGGAGFDLFEPNNNYVKVYTPKAEPGPDTWRRMVYQAKPRMQLENVFGTFDCPDAGQIAPRRTSSTTPLQALSLLNSPFLLQQAGFLAERLKRDAGAGFAAQVRRAFALLYGRTSSPDEENAGAKFIEEQGLTALCRALLNTNEFLYVF